jgi:hypothetical protein
MKPYDTLFQGQQNKGRGEIKREERTEHRREKQITDH